jgi:hypothetical protein
MPTSIPHSPHVKPSRYTGCSWFWSTGVSWSDTSGPRLWLIHGPSLFGVSRLRLDEWTAMPAKSTNATARLSHDRCAGLPAPCAPSPLGRRKAPDGPRGARCLSSPDRPESAAAHPKISRGISAVSRASIPCPCSRLKRNAWMTSLPAVSRGTKSTRRSFAEEPQEQRKDAQREEHAQPPKNISVHLRPPAGLHDSKPWTRGRTIED